MTSVRCHTRITISFLKSLISRQTSTNKNYKISHAVSRRQLKTIKQLEQYPSKEQRNLRQVKRKYKKYDINRGQQYRSTRCVIGRE